MMFPLVIRDPAMSKDALVVHLEERGIETRDMLPLLHQPFYVKIFGDLEPAYPVAQHIRKNGFYIGCHQRMTAQDVEEVARAFREFFQPYV